MRAQQNMSAIFNYTKAVDSYFSLKFRYNEMFMHFIVYFVSSLVYQNTCKFAKFTTI